MGLTFSNSALIQPYRAFALRTVFGLTIRISKQSVVWPLGLKIICGLTSKISEQLLDKLADNVRQFSNKYANNVIEHPLEGVCQQACGLL